MAAMRAGGRSAGAVETAAMLRELHDESLVWTSVPALALGFLLLAAAERFPQPAHAGLPALVLIALPVTVWVLRPGSYLRAAWALVLGLALADLLLAVWGHVGVAACLLALPVGLAALFISPGAGILSATAAGLFLLLAPGAFLPADGALRLTGLILSWGCLGLVWLTQRPLVAAWEWSWSSREQSRRLLEQARDYQLQLKQTLADLADANLQLTRLNRLAQGLRQAAEKARASKEQFVANVSHELRTPLNMIIGFSEVIVKAPKAYGARIPPALLADLTVILRNSQHLSSLIDDVLDLSQIEAGRMALTKERVALPEVVEAAATAVRPLYESKGLRLEIALAEDLPLVFCDRTRVREVLLNLLSNAGRFTERGGVGVRAWRDGGDVLVSVTDTGPGVAEADRSRIFQPFQQGDGSLRRLHGGSGLGLSISRAFVELHGGSMWLESELGSGTTFYFRLPIDPPAEIEGAVSRWFNPYWHYEERTRRPLAPAPVIRPRLVLLEQGDSLRRLLTRYLDGAELVPVHDLEEALAELVRVPAQALLVNDVSASDTLQRLQATALPYGTPAIICSVPGLPQAAGSLGIADYLVKPIARERLLQALERLQLGGRTVLVVDDEPEALRLFQRTLGSAAERYRVLVAGDGQHALNVLREQRPDAILLDLVMPEMDGFRLLEVLGQDAALREIPVIVVSALDPAGQPIVGNGLAVTRGGGFSLPQLLACIEALNRILATAGQAADPAPPTASPG